MEPKILPSNVFWGKRSGKYVEMKPKGHNVPFGHCIQQAQWSSGKERQGRPSKSSLTNVPKKWFVN